MLHASVNEVWSAGALILVIIVGLAAGNITKQNWEQTILDLSAGAGDAGGAAGAGGSAACTSPSSFLRAASQAALYRSCTLLHSIREDRADHTSGRYNTTHSSLDLLPLPSRQ